MLRERARRARDVGPTKIELAINASTARMLDLTVTPTLQADAENAIE